MAGAPVSPEKQRRSDGRGAQRTGVGQGRGEARENARDETSCSDGSGEDETKGDTGLSDESSSDEELLDAILEYVEVMTEEQAADCQPLPRELKERLCALLDTGSSHQMPCILLPLLLAATYAFLCSVARQTRTFQGTPCLLANASFAAAAMSLNIVTS